MSGGISPKDLVIHRENRQGWVYFNHYSSTNCNVYDVTHATGVEIGLCRPRRKLDHAAAGSVLHYLSEQDGNVYIREYIDLKCRNTKTKWDLATRRFHDVETEVTINSCTMRSPDTDPEHAYSQKVSNERRLPLYGTYVVSLGFDDYDTCSYTQQLQSIHTATLATHYSAQYGGCQLNDGKYQIYDCSSGSPTLNVYIDKSCSRLAYAIPLGHSCVEGVQEGEFIAYSYWSCSLNGDILPIMQLKTETTASASYTYIALVSIGLLAVVGAIVGALYWCCGPKKKLKVDDDIPRAPHRPNSGNFQSFASPFRRELSEDTFRRNVANSNVNSSRFTVHPNQPVAAPPTSPLTMRNVQKHSPVTSNMAPTSTLSSNFDVEDQPQANLSSSQYSVPNTNGSITSSALAAAAASSGHNTVKSLSSTSAATTHAHSSQSNTSSSLEQTLSIKERLRALKDDDMHKNMPSSPSDELARKFGSLGVGDNGRNDRRNKGAPSLASTRLSSSSGSYHGGRHGRSHYHRGKDHGRRRSHRKSSRHYASSDDSYETDDSYSDSISDCDDDSQYSYDTESDSSGGDYRSRRFHSNNHDGRSSRRKQRSKYSRDDGYSARERDLYRDGREYERHRDRRSSRSSSKRHGDVHRRTRDGDRYRACREDDYVDRFRNRSRSTSVSSRRSESSQRSQFREESNRDRRHVTSRSRSPPPSHLQPPPPFSHYSPMKESFSRGRGDRNDVYKSESTHNTPQEHYQRSASASSKHPPGEKPGRHGHDEGRREYAPFKNTDGYVDAPTKRHSSSSSNIRAEPQRHEYFHASKHATSTSDLPVVEMGRKSLGLRRVDSSGNISHRQPHR